MTRHIKVYLMLAQWQLWPVWSRGDPERAFLGPLVITWYRS